MFLWLLLLLGPTPARAQEATQGEQTERAAAERDAEGRWLFERGRTAYTEGDYAKAYELFKQAYEVSGRPLLLFNVGQAADRLRKDREAIEAFEQYLEAMPEAANRREVENRLRALRAGDGAEPASAREQAEASAPDAAKTPSPNRKGIYAHGALGVGLMLDGRDDEAETKLSGGGPMLDLALGVGVAKGFALAVMASVEVAPKPQLRGDQGEPVEVDALTAVHAGVLADWYLRPTRHGLHLQGALLFSSLSQSADAGPVAEGSGSRGDDSVLLGSGGGLLLGAGYEWPVGDDLSFGALVRIIGSALKGKQEDVQHSYASVGVLATASWF